MIMHRIEKKGSKGYFHRLVKQSVEISRLLYCIGCTSFVTGWFYMGIESEEGCGARLMRNNEFLGKKDTI